MRGVINDALRWSIGCGIAAAGPILEGVHRLLLRLAPFQQRRLRQRYGIAADTPIVEWSDLASVLERRARQAGAAKIAVTSGSTAIPKRVPYTDRRLRSARWAYVDMFVRCRRAMRIRRPSLYIFSSLTSDDSLTALLLAEHRPPPALALLQAPYRVQSSPAVQRLALRYGTTAVRLWILAIANPGVLYATNPSTLSTFFDDLARDWDAHASLARDFCRRPYEFPREIHAVAGRLASRGSRRRLERIAASETALPLEAFAPGVEAFICWTGGDLRPFLDRLTAHLPRERFRCVPMYSMSTETIETVAHFSGGDVAFVPLAAGVCYEFLENGTRDCPDQLRTIEQLETGRTYTMVVSDRYGLKRYQTGDLFLCRGKVAGMPDLRFVGRRGVEHSFTGEKLTSEQLALVFARLREECPGLRGDDFLSCVPSHPSGTAIPHYTVVLVRGTRVGETVRDEEIAERVDALLAAVNPEYQSKRNSRRLGPVRALQMTLAEFATRVGGDIGASWETQFKFLPFYAETWESRART